MGIVSSQCCGGSEGSWVKLDEDDGQGREAQSETMAEGII